MQSSELSNRPRRSILEQGVHRQADDEHPQNEEAPVQSGTIAKRIAGVLCLSATGTHQIWDLGASWRQAQLNVSTIHLDRPLALDVLDGARRARE